MRFRLFQLDFLRSSSLKNFRETRFRYCHESFAFLDMRVLRIVLQRRDNGAAFHDSADRERQRFYGPAAIKRKQNVTRCLHNAGNKNFLRNITSVDCDNFSRWRSSAERDEIGRYKTSDDNCSYVDWRLFDV